MTGIAVYTPPSGTPLSMLRPTVAEIDMEAIAHNILQIRQRVGPKRGVMAMVKADAYGHGITAVARVTLEHGADWLGVALPEEGWVLRESGIDCPILMLGPILPDQIPLALDANLVLTVSNWELAQALNGEAARRAKRILVHVKVDTGMGRLGVSAKEAMEFLDALRSLEHVEVQGIYTHFAAADQNEKEFTYKQMGLFDGLCREASLRGISFQFKHLSNSAAILDLPDAYQDLVRPGIMIYGCYPSTLTRKILDIRPAMTWKTRVGFIRELDPGDSVSYGRTFVATRPTRIAGLLVGYADGYPLLLSNHGEVLIKGIRAPVVGAVCMDMTMVDVTHISGVELGEEAVLFGRQGDSYMDVTELAERSRSIPYEILSRVGARVPRVYFNASL